VAALDLLNKKCPPGPSRVLLGLRKWERDGTAFVFRDMVQPYSVHCILTHAKALHSLKQHRAFVEALRREGEIEPQLDQLFGHDLVSIQLTTDKVTDRLLWRVADRSDGFVFDEEVFAQEYRRLDADLRRSEFEITIVSPLVGLALDSAPIELQKGLEIDLLSDSEIADCLQGGLFPSVAAFHSVAAIKELYGVRIRYVLAKRRTALTSPEVPPIFVRLNQAVRLADEVLHALRVFAPGRVSLGGSVSISDQWPVEGWRSWAPSKHSSGAPRDFLSKGYRLDIAGSQDFAAFWNELQNAKKEGFIENAVRRFGFASDRDLPHDRLVDLMIAAESLFLRETDAGDAKYRGEMRYRLAERFAFFVGEEAGYARRSMFRHIRNAYDLRSSIVHGGAPSGDSLTVINGTVSIDEFVEMTTQLLRFGLKKMIHLQRKNALPDWTALIFG
jgi:hypothetical protein